MSTTLIDQVAHLAAVTESILSRVERVEQRIGQVEASISR